MKDALGQPLQVGDDILYIDCSSDGLRAIHRAKVVRFTPKMVGVTYTEKWRPPVRGARLLERQPNFLTTPTRVVLYRSDETCEWCGQPAFSGADA